MSKILKIAAATALIAASASASAFWGGGPWGGYPGSSSWMDDFMGDGYGDFNMSMSGGGTAAATTVTIATTAARTVTAPLTAAAMALLTATACLTALRSLRSLRSLRLPSKVELVSSHTRT